MTNEQRQELMKAWIVLCLVHTDTLDEIESTKSRTDGDIKYENAYEEFDKKVRGIFPNSIVSGDLFNMDAPNHRYASNGVDIHIKDKRYTLAFRDPLKIEESQNDW